MRTETARSEPQAREDGVPRWLRWLLLGLAATFLAIHFIHLRADLPNGAGWPDVAKLTDEGWYGDAAIRHVLFGHWRLDGDLNTAAVAPVWPLMETPLFSLFGVRPEVARSLSCVCFVGVCAVCFLLLRQADRARTLAPEIAVLILSVSPFAYAFSRLAFLETPMLLFTLLALLMAGYTARNRVALLALGALVPMAVLTKSSAIVVLPAIAWYLWRTLHGVRGTRWLGVLWRICAPAAMVSAVYGGWVLREHLQIDIHTYFDALHDRVNIHVVLPMTWRLLTDLRWIGPVLAPLAVLGALVSLRRMRRDALTQALWLWVVIYLAFVLYHSNLQPRYLLMVAAPLWMMLAREIAELLTISGWPARLTAGLLVLALAVEGSRTVDWAMHPRYTWWDTAQAIRAIVDAAPGHSRAIQCTSGAELALMIGLPHMAGDLTTLKTEQLTARYRPGWYCSWEGRNVGRAEERLRNAVLPGFRRTEVRRFRVMDDPDRDILILDRLDPESAAPAGTVR